ncbi:hypothetical protein Dimus_031645, partial [Dionaea muscipula]
FGSSKLKGPIREPSIQVPPKGRPRTATVLAAFRDQRATSLGCGQTYGLLETDF